uniref:hypothetical protein n=1 Tax=Chryseobacterium aquaticum TaxID=452084 RepID=UPI002FCAD228
DAKIKSQAIKEFFLRCENIYDGTETGGGGEWWVGSGGGTDSGTGGEPLGPGNPEPCNGNGVATNPLEPNTNIGEGGCSGIPTVVTVPPIRITPCQKLSNLLDPTKANIKPLITGGLYTAVNNAAGETGIALKRESNGAITNEILPYTPNPNGENPSINIKTGGSYYSSIHSHPKDAYPMFSWSDVYSLYKLEMGTASHNTMQSSFLLVCEDDSGVKQTYAIVFENTGLMMEDVMNNPENIRCTAQEIKNKMDIELKEKYDNEAKKTNPNYERVFLQLNYGTNIGLYKANSDLTSWQKLSINSNSDTAIVVPANCN